jgi:hypothetical protein
MSVTKTIVFAAVSCIASSKIYFISMSEAVPKSPEIEVPKYLALDPSVRRSSIFALLNLCPRRWQGPVVSLVASDALPPAPATDIAKAAS